MICTGCGENFAIGDAVQQAEARCPRCGKVVAGSPVSHSKLDDSATLQYRAPEKEGEAQPAAPVPPAASQAQTEISNDATLALKPGAAKPKPTYKFLSPATSDDEMGWLGHYRVLRVLGEGGMGIVFEAIDTQLQRAVALKVMKAEIAEDEFARHRFLREARATAAVKSDHIVTIHQVNEVQQVPYLAMEFLQGEPLDLWMKRNPRPDLAHIVRMAIEITRGLAAAHARGLIHRDIKPTNIWLEAPSGRVKILDFGLAHDANDQVVLTQTGLVLGTPSYMAPEQAEGLAVDTRCDLFSLGCLLYEIVGGERPFTGATTMAVLLAVANKEPRPLAELNSDVPAELIDLIMHLLRKKPADRPESADQVLAELEALATELELPLKASSGHSWIRSRPVRVLQRPRSRGPLKAVGAVLLLVAVGLVGWFLPPPFSNRPDIVVGMSGPFSGTARELGRQMELGINTYFSLINDQGGVKGRKLKLIALDDGYEPERALANMSELHEVRKVSAVLGNIGTPTAAKTVPYALENKMLFFGGFTGAKLLRKDPPDRYVFNYRASYEEETAAIVAHLVNIRKIRPEQIAVFAQTDGYGEDGFRGVVKTLRQYGRDAKDTIKVGYERNTVHVQDAVREILKHKDLRAVVMVATYQPASAFIQKIKDAGRRDLIFTNVSFVGSEALAEDLRIAGADYADGVIVTQVVPPIDSSATIVLTYSAALKNYYPNESQSFVSLEGYIIAAIFVEGLKRAGNDLSTENVIKALESLRDLDLGIGAAVTFGASDHQASHRVWGSVLDNSARYRHLELHE